MRESQMNIRLVPSKWMDDRKDKESGVIRIPKRARLYFEVGSKATLELRSASRKLNLQVKAARLDDVMALYKRVKAGEITEEQANISAFVTEEVYSTIVGQRKKDVEKHCWISSGIDNLIIGADPEFCLVDPRTGDYFYAQNDGNLTLRQQLGADGPLAEVRPKQEDSVEGLVKNIETILKRDGKKIENYGWVGGATFKGNGKLSQQRTLQMGGHIHVGDPAVLPPAVRKQAHSRIIQMLDETIAIPMVRVDTPDAPERRKRYGKWGDQRPQEGRFEWRVPSGWWLLHPQSAKAVLGTTKALSEACYSRMAEHGFDNSWISAPRSGEGFLKSWGAVEEERAADIVNSSLRSKVDSSLYSKLVKRLRGLENYKTYREDIESFIELTDLSVKDVKNVSLDLKENWLTGGPLIKEA